MARSSASLPIQDDIGGDTSRTRKPNVEECLRCQIEPGNSRGKRAAGLNTRPIELQVLLQLTISK